MSCGKFRDERLLAAYGEEAGPEFAAHLPRCAECRAALADIHSVRASYEALGPDALPDRVARRLAPSRGIRWVVLSTAAAVAASLLALLWIPRVGPTAVPNPAGEPPVAERSIPDELDQIDQELAWQEMVLKEE